MIASIQFLAKALRLDDRGDEVEAGEPALPARPQSDLATIEVEEGSPVAGSRVVFGGLPDDTIVLLVYRRNEFFVSNGRTVIEAGDRLVVLTSKSSVDGARARFAGSAPSSDEDRVS